MPHFSLQKTLEELQQQAPNTTFLALGQTVFWDEPMKAAWRRILDREWPSAQLVAGVHDTDYFAKTTAHVSDTEEFAALAHDDGATRGLWSAAGELSSLLGSEDVPTRAFYESLGIPFDKLAGRDSIERRNFYAEYTSAYGWRGVVQTVGSAQIAHDVLAKKFGPALLALLEWGFKQSLSCLEGQTAASAQEIADKICSWVSSFLESCHDECTLSELYQYLLPKFYELLLDFEPTNFSVTSTASLLLFNPATAQLPRFHFVQLFLDPNTRDYARAAYSKAVAGGGMYALDHFGPSALPFDVVVPGAGRGTLHVGDGSITIDFPPVPIKVATQGTITSLDELSRVLAKEFGDNVILVGKAVSLISMLSAEFTLIFHETASGYTDRTAAMNSALRQKGIELKLNPIVRLQYQTWDSLTDINNSNLLLPEHLAETFQTNGKPIAAPLFANRWREVVSEQKKNLTQLRQLRSLKDILAYFGSRSHTDWAPRIEDLSTQRALIKHIFSQTADYRKQMEEIKCEIRVLQAQRNSLEEKSAKDYKQRLRPLQELALAGDENASKQAADVDKDRQIQFVDRILGIANDQRSLKKQLKELLAVKRRAERTEAAIEARTKIATIERDANLEKLAAARRAYLTLHGLPHTNSRPTFWWLPMVDPTGTWFDNITDTLEARLEEV
jgi:hypothetical protein